MSNIWQVQEAKNRFSQVLDEAIEHGPQTITRRGKKAAVLISASDYRKLIKEQDSVAKFLLKSPLQSSGLKIERSKDTGRDIDL